MRRADRLFQIIHALRGRRTALPARELAERLEVSLRTVYRDVADLQGSGVPIEGEAGVGYMLRQGPLDKPVQVSPALSVRKPRRTGEGRLVAWRGSATQACGQTEPAPSS